MNAQAEEESLLRRLLGGTAAVGLLAYVAWVHHGTGYDASGLPAMWWHPSGFLLVSETLVNLSESWVGPTAALCLPALILCAAVFAGTRSGVARGLALSCVFAVLLFGFYGFYAQRAWNFFHWRGSLTLISTSAVLGFALAAPWLAASWLRRHFVFQALLYVPVFLVVTAFLRNATGTDERLAFNFSPWPAVSMFGLDHGVYSVLGLLFGWTLAAIGFQQWSERRGFALACLLAAITLPYLWFVGRFGSAPAPVAIALGAFSLIGIALVGIAAGGERSARLAQRSLHLAVGTALVALPVLGGRALARGDYSFNRSVQAQRLIDALDQHFSEREEYPDRLEDLVDEGKLSAIPVPRVGYSLFYELGNYPVPRFSYQNLGSSYILEFESTEWRQCAYNPPWPEDEYEDYEEEQEEEEEEEFGSEGAWSCPTSPPELW